ncbi:MAG: SUMF1/EgtB/PvdO family nonheme iron enzyme [Sedimentisphaerales bacterium]|nr:SUMF1/EgtB/PvdO family nonheme iron enzyme [Sedimentisphaerales bacterium]
MKKGNYIKFFLVIFIFSGCHEPDNPVDWSGNNYQGYPVFSDVDLFELVDVSGGMWTPQFLICSQIIGATGYDFEIDDNSDFSSPIFSKVNHSSNKCDLSAAVLLIGDYSWRARLETPRGKSGWLASSFSMRDCGFISRNWYGALLLQWSDLYTTWSSGLSYDLQIAASFESVSSAVIISCPDNEYQVNEIVNEKTTRYWRVRASYSQGIPTGWSGVSTFLLDMPVTGNMYSYFAENLSFDMHYVEAKSFFTGTNDSGSGEVAIDYLISATEVTYQLWNVVCSWASINGYAFSHSGVMGDGNADSELHPVTSISCRDAIVWCNALTEWYNANNGFESDLGCVYFTDAAFINPLRTSTDSTTMTINVDGSQDAPYIDPEGDGFRLPTGLEWESAARYIEDLNEDGDIMDDGEYYPGNYASGAASDYNNSIETGYVAWYKSNSNSSTHPVAGKNSNALRLYDMSGNVWEMCFNTDSAYWGTRWVLRGGGWPGTATELQVGKVGEIYPYYMDNSNGFRTSRTVVIPP